MALGTPNSSPQCLWGGEQGDGVSFFTVVHGEMRRDNMCKLKETESKEDFFHMRTAGQGSKLLEEVVLSLTLKAVKTCLDTTLSNLV